MKFCGNFLEGTGDMCTALLSSKADKTAVCIFYYYFSGGFNLTICILFANVKYPLTFRGIHPLKMPNFSCFIRKILTFWAFQVVSVTANLLSPRLGLCCGWYAVSPSMRIRHPASMGLQSKWASREWCRTQGKLSDHNDANQKETGATGRGTQMIHLLPLLSSSFPFQKKLLWHENYHYTF